MASLRRKIVTWALSGYWCSLFVVTHVPGDLVPMGPHGSDKMIHFAAYIGLSLLLASYRQVVFPNQRVRGFTILLCIAVYAGVDEVTQTLPFIRRHADWDDFIADILGALAGVAAFVQIQNGFRRDEEISDIR